MQSENPNPLIQPVHVRYRRSKVSVVVGGVDVTNSITAGGLSIEFPEVCGEMDPLVTLTLHADVEVYLDAAEVRTA